LNFGIREEDFIGQASAINVAKARLRSASKPDWRNEQIAQIGVAAGLDLVDRVRAPMSLISTSASNSSMTSRRLDGRFCADRTPAHQSVGVTYKR